jgi:hypothetical protein
VVSGATAGEFATVGFRDRHCLCIGSNAVPDVFDQLDALG